MASDNINTVDVLANKCLVVAVVVAVAVALAAQVFVLAAAEAVLHVAAIEALVDAAVDHICCHNIHVEVNQICNNLVNFFLVNDSLNFKHFYDKLLIRNLSNKLYDTIKEYKFAKITIFKRAGIKKFIRNMIMCAMNSWPSTL